MATRALIDELGIPLGIYFTMGDDPEMPKVIDNTDTIADIAGRLAKIADIPELAESMGSVIVATKTIANMNKAVKELSVLEGRLNDLYEMIKRITDNSEGGKLSDPLKERLKSLASKWNEKSEEVRKMQNRSIISLWWYADSDRKDVADLHAEITTSIHEFMLEESVITSNTTHHTLKGVESIKVQLDDSFMRDIPFARNARYDRSNVRNQCLPGTRLGILDVLRKRITDICTQEATTLADRRGIVVWVNGFAGSGKTTIAFSVAQWCDSQGILGGDFFCCSFDPECSDPNLIFSTISRQLCRYPPFREKVAAILKDDPNIAQSGPSRQFEKLVLLPLEELGDTFPMMIVVIDALDECQDDNTTSTFLAILAKYRSRILKFLSFIVTSRPEPRIAAIFAAARKESLDTVTTILQLHRIDIEDTREDIRSYLLDGFQRIHEAYTVPKDWPARQHVEKLVDMSKGLFIFASTALRFITDTAYRDPRGQLELLLEMQSNTEVSKTMLDLLYGQIITASHRRVSSPLAARLRTVLGTISVAQEPLSTAMLAIFLKLSEDAIKNALSGLHSVLFIPTDDHEPILVIHPTFPEFLAQHPEPQEASSAPNPFYIHLPEHHRLIFSRCLALMQELRRNIVGIPSPALFKDEVYDLTDKISQHIPPCLSYACRYWAVHFYACRDVTSVAETEAAFKSFASRKLLYWLEACSLLQAYDIALAALDTARTVCQIIGDPFEDLADLFADGRRFALTYAACVDLAPLQIYDSALALAPSTSKLKEIYARELQKSLYVAQGSLADWEPCIDTFVGHNRLAALSVAFSPDGKTFVTGGKDRTFKIWKSATRRLLLTVKGHTAAVNCVAYSPDGTRVVSGSSDLAICIWEVASGQCVDTLIRHEYPVSFVTYAGDGSYILSASEQGEIILWDLSNEERIVLSEAGVDRMLQAAISPDGNTIAYGTQDHLELFNVPSQTLDSTIDFPGSVVAATFSPDGRKVAARTQNVVKIWAIPEQSLICSITVGTTSITGRLAFSKDGTRVCFGCTDGTIRLWHAAPGAPPRIFDGPVSEFHDFAWSLDGSQIISVASDGTVRVWDTAYRFVRVSMRSQGLIAPSPPRLAVIRHEGTATLLYLPALTNDTHDLKNGLCIPDDRPQMASFVATMDAWEYIINVAQTDPASLLVACHWTSLTGIKHARFESPRTVVSRVLFRMAYPSPSSDSAYCLCDIRTGETLPALTVGSPVYSAAFSPDATLLATASADNIVRIWEVVTQTLVSQHAVHTKKIHAISFSSDGRFLVSVAEDRTVPVYKVATERIVRVFSLPYDWPWVEGANMLVSETHLLLQDDVGNVHIWDTSSGNYILKIPLGTPRGWVDQLNFNSDDTGIVCQDKDGRTYTIALWKPGDRTWPVFHVTGDGWVYAKGPGWTRRVCWLPPTWRNPLASEGNAFYVYDKERERIVVLDLSKLL